MIDSNSIITDAQIEAIYGDDCLRAVSADDRRERIRRVIEFAIAAHETPKDPYVVADLFGARAGDSPSIVMLRPRRPLTDTEEENVTSFFYKHIKVPNIRFVVMPEHFDILAIGEAELERLVVKAPIGAEKET